LNFLKRQRQTSKVTTGLCQREDGLCLVHLEKGKEPFRLTVCDFLEGHQPGVEADGLLERVKLHRLTSATTVVVLELGRYNLYQLEPPEVPAAEVRDAVRWSLKDMLDFPLEEAVIDLFPVPYEDLRNRSRLVQVVVARFPEVQRQVELLRQARLKIVAIDITEFAIRNIVTLLPENSSGLVFIYFGAKRGLITIFRDSQLYLTRTINLGCFDLLRFSREEGGADPQVDPSPQLLELLASVVLEVQRSLDFFESTFFQDPIGNVVIGPLETPVPELLPYLQQALGGTVRSLDLASILDCQGLSVEEQARALPAIGGALRRE
jgi:MSHA biogenesis protein MshI